MTLNKPLRPRGDLVSAGSLGPIQGGVCLPKKPSKLGCAERFRSHTDADGELRGKILLKKRTRFTCLAKTFRNRDGCLVVNAWQKDHELVSALSSQYCGAASDRLFQHLGE